jgi:hypothetical protein
LHITELRNLVYDYIIAGIDLSYDYTSEGHGLKYVYFFMPKYCSGFEIGQTCKQLRTEFRCLYFAQVPKWIPLQFIHSYLTTFHSGNNSVADDVTVDLIKIASKNADVPDIFPLMKRLSDLPNVVCKFDNTVTWVQGRSLTGLGPILTRCAKRASTAVIEWKLAAAKLRWIDLCWSNKRVLLNVKYRFKLKARARKRFEKDLLDALALYPWGRWMIIFKYV